MNFNFGKAPTSNTSSSTGTTGTSSTASTTSTGPAFSFNFQTNNTSKPGTTGAAASEPVNIPPELKNKTVKNVLETMESQLEQQARQFQTQARQIARWDRSIYDCLDLMIFLESQIKTVEGSQKELAQSANSLLQEQETFINTLREKTNKSTALTNDQRSKLYATAKKLGEDFLEMESQLKEIVEQTESENAADSTSDIDKVAQIANCHLDSMQWIANQCATIEEKLDAIMKSLPDTA
ncbi:hypothetical protein TRFO_26650 [Tritrichomonas foetus]|uniref:Nucleoporin NSP1-like C-terminal domain-containing protein n=1 Tax=Tritrichomonas foetus TaxID=1144522 RepID=A0A1J4K2A4_9EUKA|nr:hypothetical protein TRFO_26650 [Tritrichomonas foetus]|eukprot:OHT05577.1 hypothetical protein TRFO_26650 [Tritrichomonas foetus]